MVGGCGGPGGHDFDQIRANEMEGGAIISRVTGWHAISDELVIGRASAGLAIVVGASEASMKPRPSSSRSNPPKESVTLALNQQIIPALSPQKIFPLSQASLKIVSSPWLRHIAKRLTVLPPLTYMISCSPINPANSDESEGFRDRDPE